MQFNIKTWFSCAVCAVIFSVSPFVLANNVSSQMFKVESKHQLHVIWYGHQLITGDSIVCIGPKVFDSPDGVQTQNIDGMKVTDVWSKATHNQPIAYRREVATTPDKIELAVQFQVPSYFNYPDGNTPYGSNAYRFSVPISTLQGMTYKAIYGRGYQYKIKKGKITANMPDGKIVYTRFIAFSDPTGKRPGLVFDFNPKGPSAFNDYGPTSLLGYWWIVKQGKQLHFCFGSSPHVYGAVVNSIIRIHEGTFNDYSKWHAHKTYRYYSVLPAIRRLNFSSNHTSKKWIPAGIKQYNLSHGYGWLRNTGLKQVRNNRSGVLHGFVRGNKKHKLRINIPQPGVYVFTVRIGSPTNKIGPFTLSAGGKIAAKNITVNPGQVCTITFSRYPTQKHIVLSWRGDWAVSTIALQALIYQPQDFAIKRGVWLMDNVPTPTSFFLFSRHPIPPKAAVQKIKSISHGVSVQKVRAVTMNPVKSVVPSPNDPELGWRWTSNITSLGPSNKGSFYEFDTPKEINRRLDQLQSYGFNTILVNGLLMRRCYPDQTERITRTMSLIAKLAHSRGMHVLDHQDLSIMTMQNAGLKVFVNHIGWMQRDVRNGEVTRGIDLDNPNFNKWYWKHITNYVKATNIDGLMIDEATFHGLMYSGSKYCRQKFHKATGLYLPTDNLKNVIMNRNNPLWRLWLRWRLQTVAKWFVHLREHIQKVKPNFVLMKYTTNHGLSTNYASIGFGANVINESTSAGWIGTEIMSRNVYATYRANYAYRSMFNSIHNAFGSPMYGLVYSHGDPVIGYAGWAMNSMHGQATWVLAGYKAVMNDAKRYINWQHGMNRQKAKHVASVCVLFSSASRDFPKYFRYHDAIEGVTEQLDDMHVMYDVLLGRNMTLKRLKHYKLLILPSAFCMNNNRLNAIIEYLLEGGHVLALGPTTTLDEIGLKRNNWPIGKLLGLKFTGKLLPKNNYKLFGPLVNNASVKFDYAITHVVKNSSVNAFPKVLMHAKYGNKSSIAAASARVGKGHILYVAPRLGAAVSQPSTLRSGPWTYRPKPKLQNLLSRVIYKAYGHQSIPFKEIKIPKKVYVNVFRQPKTNSPNKVETLVHLYNASGVPDIKVGERIPDHPPKHPFPPINSKMIFNIKIKSTNTISGTYYSPDIQSSNSSKPIQVKSLGNNIYQITVPPYTLHAYGIIYLTSSP